ncbi:MAG: TatD family hydrolase [Candidatus Nealsonbacteria bacterium]|nr:TatD family hydrolase [Candidatus Nealsonbacteria bacterium]
MLIDSHSHLNFSAFKEDREKIIKECLKNNIWMINVGSQYDTSKKAVEIAEQYEKGVYAAIGLHPIHLDTGLVKMRIDEEEVEFNSKEENFDYQKYKELAKSKKVVAIGETGFDYYWRPKTTAKKELFRQKQKELFLEHLKLAKELQLPVIFHCRMAQKDLIKTLLENSELKPQKAVAHSFVGNKEDLKQYLDLGYYIGFNGIIFKKIQGINFEEVIKETPLEKLLIETDCPYLAPPPFLGERNTPIYVRYVAEKIARIKNRKIEEIEEITSQNAKQLFNI